MKNAINTLVLVSGVTLLAGPGCAGWQATAKTIDQAAVMACRAYFGTEKPSLSPEEVARYFCAAAEDLAPFITAIRQAGTVSSSLHVPAR